MEVFRCDNGNTIPVSVYCDFLDHCGDQTDEYSCGI